MATKKNSGSSKPKSSGSSYTKGSTGYDSKGNRVSTNSSSAVSVGTVRGGASSATPVSGGNRGPSDAGTMIPGNGGIVASGTAATSQAKETVGGKVYDYTRSSDPAITERNRQRAMGSAYRPPSSSIVATSDTARSQVEDATSYLTRSEQRAKLERERRTQQKQEEAAAAAAPGATDTSSTAKDKVSAMLGDIADPTVQGRALVNADAQEAAQRAYQSEMARAQRKIDVLARDMDDRTSAIIDGINQEYAGLMDEQRAANEAYQAGTVTAGLTSGRSQYAPEIQGGIVKAAFDQGIAKLEDLQAKRAQLVLEAETARDERNYKMLTAKMDLIRQSYQDEREFASQLQTDIREAAKFQTEMHDYVGESLAPTLYQALTGDAAADAELVQAVAAQSGVPAYVIQRKVDDYRRQQQSDAPGAVGEFIYLQQNGMLPSGVTSYASYVNWKEAVGKTGSGGGGRTIGRDLANESGLTSIADASYDSFDAVALDGAGQFAERLGLESEELQQSLDGKFFPEWYKQEYLNSNGFVPSDTDLQKEWTKWKQTPAAIEIRTGRRPTAAAADSTEAMAAEWAAYQASLRANPDTNGDGVPG